jgi:hypothetical protein
MKKAESACRPIRLKAQLGYSTNCTLGKPLAIKFLHITAMVALLRTLGLAAPHGSYDLGRWFHLRAAPYRMNRF